MKVGLFFGSFNPIHVGHLIIARHLLDFTELEKIWFVVSPHNPHKDKKTLLEDIHRLALVRVAIEGEPNFKAEDVEFHMPQPSYTVDTLTVLQDKYPNYEFSVLMGEDNLKTLHKWKNYEQILEKFSIYVYPRPEIKENLRVVMPHENIHFCENVPVMRLSASFVRQLIKEGKSTEYLLTDPVRKYIEEMNFYKK